MTEVPKANRLAVLDAKHISNDILLPYQMPEKHIVRRVAQDMTDAKHWLFPGPKPLLRILQRLVHPDTALQPRTHRLLTADMHSQMCNTADNLLMQLIQHTDKHGIDTSLDRHATGLAFPPLLLICDPFPPIDELLAPLSRQFAGPDELLAERFALGAEWLAYGCYNCVGALEGGFCVRGAPASCADDEDAGWVSEGLEVGGFEVCLVAVGKGV